MTAFTDYAQVRKNWELKIAAKIVDAEKWNYLYFSQGGKTYYYFITNVVFVSDDTVKLFLEMDVMQTYMFDYALQPCFVEREHATTDNIGDNTVEEGLELGAFVNVGRSTPDFFNGDMSVLMMTSASLDDYGIAKCSMYDGIFSGCYVYRIDTGMIAEMRNLFNRLNEDGKTDIILAMWMYPDELLEFDGDTDSAYMLVKEQKTAGIDYYPNKPSSIGGYTPRNNKLFTYPYNFLYVTNNNGNTAVYRYERFENGTPYFELEGSMFPDGGIKFTPKNYNGVGYNYDEALTFTSLPTCPWVSDTYKIWLAQNQNQHMANDVQNGITALGGALMTVAGIATLAAGGSGVGLIGAGVATMTSGFMNIASQMAQVEDMKIQPPQSHGGASATLNMSLKNFIDVYQRTISAERARMIDDFFTMYGYKTLRVKKPNRNVRERWTFTKTSNCYITGSLCQEDARKIQSIYNNGVTFWNKDATIGNYTASNAVL